MLGSGGQLLYDQVRKTIEERIERGVYKAGSALPPIRAIAQELGVSSITIRRAIKDLQNVGRVRSVAGLGTFVSGRERLIRHIGASGGPIYGMTDDAERAGRSISTKHISIEYQTPDDPALMLMGMPAQRCLAFRKAIILDGEPVSLDTTFVLGEISPEMVEAFSKDFVWQVLKRENISTESKVQYFDAAPADEEFSREIKVPIGYPTIRSLYKTVHRKEKFTIYGICVSAFDSVGYYMESLDL